MRVGVCDGPLPFDLDAVDDRVAAKIEELGFTGVGAHFGYGQGLAPADLTPGACERVREVLAARGIEIVQLWGWEPNLIHPDAAQRARDIARLSEATRVAADLGAPIVLCGSGSGNPRGAYWPHPLNHTPAAMDRLVDSLRRVAPGAADRGVVIALECHCATTLDTPERVRAVLEAVGSPAVRVNLDPVNFLADLPTLFDTAPLLDRVFDQLGPFAVSGHVKDAYAEERLVVHISETLLGDGVFDVRGYLERFEAALPDAYVFVEHLPEELVPRAKLALDGLLAELRITPRPARG
jgi:sugar phosphate isomerase/epimerase